jgi:hypothetical protein
MHLYIANDLFIKWTISQETGVRRLYWIKSWSCIYVTQHNSPTKPSSNLVLEQRLRCYQLKYLYILVLHIWVN